MSMASILMVLMFSALGCNRPGEMIDLASGAPTPNTFFVDGCEFGEKTRHVLSPVFYSEDDQWRAYVDIEDTGCLMKATLWVSRANAPYRLIYFMPPKPYQGGNGMEILGWNKDASLLLVKTVQWQSHSDAPSTEQVLAINPATGEVYDSNLEAMLDDRKDMLCTFSVTGAGFRAEKSVEILIRAKFTTLLDLGDEEENVPPAKRCMDSEETWSFHYATLSVDRAASTEPLRVFGKYLPPRLDVKARK